MHLLCAAAKEDEEVPAAVYQLLRQCGSGLQLERPGERVRVAEEIVEQLKRKGVCVECAIFLWLPHSYNIHPLADTPSKGHHTKLIPYSRKI